MSAHGTRGTIVVVGGGISGITAAIEASEAGCQVVLVEKSASLGGRVARSNLYFPKLCPPQCGLEINLRRIRTSPNIRCLTLAEVLSVAGKTGNYQVTIRVEPRRVNEKCTVCGACVEACPVERPDDFNLGLSTTKAIYLPHDQAHPMRFTIDGTVCPGTECGKCVPACPFDAIDLEMEAQTIAIDAQAVIWATGWDPFDATKIEGLGFGTHADVITNVHLERLASPTGPTGGKILRPSDQKELSSVAFVQCAGSRDENYLKYCSGVCCLASLKQSRYVREQYPEAEIYVFYIDLRAPGRLEDFLATAKRDQRLKLIKGKVARITEDPSTGDLEVEAEDTLSGSSLKQKVDLVVLATGMVPASRGEVEVDGALSSDEHGFLTGEQQQEGFMAVGCAKRPTDVATCVRDATGAAMKALQIRGE